MSDPTPYTPMSLSYSTLYNAFGSSIEYYLVNLLMDDEEQQAVNHFKTTHKVLESGRFSVQLPRKKPAPPLANLARQPSGDTYRTRRHYRREGNSVNSRTSLKNSLHFGTLRRCHLIRSPLLHQLRSNYRSMG